MVDSSVEPLEDSGPDASAARTTLPLCGGKKKKRKKKVHFSFHRSIVNGGHFVYDPGSSYL